MSKKKILKENAKFKVKKRNSLINEANKFMINEDDSEPDWLVKAIKQLAKSEDLDEENYEIQDFDDYGVSVDIDGQEYRVMEDEAEAERIAIEYVKDQLESEPELFNMDFLKNYIYITDTDKRIIAGEEAANMYDDMDENEILERYASEFNKDIDELDENDVEEYRDELRDERYDYVKKELDDPIKYFVDEQGIYTLEDLFNANFILINNDDAAEAAVNEDGVGHFLAHYDNEQIDLDGGAVAYRTN